MKVDYQLSNHNQDIDIDFELLRPDVFIWNKVSLFVWRFLFNLLATKDDLYIREIYIKILNFASMGVLCNG